MPALSDPKCDSVGLAVERYLDRYGLRVHQTPTSPATFIRKCSGESSRPDLTISTPRLFRVSETTVLDGIGSDHLPLLTTITLNFRRDVTAPSHFIYKDADWDKFTSILEDGVATLDIKRGTLDQAYQRLTRLIMTVAHSAIPRVPVRRSRGLWSGNLSRLKSERNCLQCRLSRCLSRANLLAYRLCCRKMRQAVRSLQQNTWREGVSVLNYRTCADRIQRGKRNRD